MENVVLNPPQKEYTDFMSLPMGVYKNIQYFNGIQGRSYYESSVLKKEGCMHYAHTVFRVKKSKDGYYRQSTHRNGFTLNEKGKLSVWFGKNIFEVPGIWAVFTHLNMNWLTDKLVPFVTKSIAEKILNGKITNNIDVVRAYIKVMRLTCSPRLLFDVIRNNIYNKPHLLQMLSIAKDQDHFLQKCIRESDNYPHTESFYLTDLVKQAQILNRKIDFTWSHNRIKEEHQQWTKEIMDVEVNDMVDVVAESTLPFLEFNFEGFKLLTTKKEVYKEGKSMNHCVYTNYWNSVQHGHYLVYHIDLYGEEATLGCYISESITCNQCYGRNNSSVSNRIREQLSVFLDAINTWAGEKKIIKQPLSFV